MPTPGQVKESTPRSTDGGLRSSYPNSITITSQTPRANVKMDTRLASLTNAGTANTTGSTTPTNGITSKQRRSMKLNSTALPTNIAQPPNNTTFTSEQNNDDGKKKKGKLHEYAEIQEKVDWFFQLNDNITRDEFYQFNREQGLTCFFSFSVILIICALLPAMILSIIDIAQYQPHHEEGRISTDARSTFYQHSLIFTIITFILTLILAVLGIYIHCYHPSSSQFRFFWVHFWQTMVSWLPVERANERIGLLGQHCPHLIAFLSWLSQCVAFKSNNNRVADESSPQFSKTSGRSSQFPLSTTKSPPGSKEIIFSTHSSTLKPPTNGIISGGSTIRKPGPGLPATSIYHGSLHGPFVSKVAPIQLSNDHIVMNSANSWSRIDQLWLRIVFPFKAWYGQFDAMRCSKQAFVIIAEAIYYVTFIRNAVLRECLSDSDAVSNTTHSIDTRMFQSRGHVLPKAFSACDYPDFYIVFHGWLLLFLPFFLFISLPDVSIVWVWLTLGMTIIVISCVAAYMNANHCWIIIVYVIAVCCLIIDTQIRKIQMFLLTKDLKETLAENQRMADENHAQEMRHMIANVAHDLKTVSVPVCLINATF